MDLLRYQSFRQTLLCHDHVTVMRSVSPSALDGLYFAAHIRPRNESLDLKSSASEEFVSAHGPVVAGAVPAVKAALYHWGTIWPRATVPLDELARRRRDSARIGSRPNGIDRGRQAR